MEKNMKKILLIACLSIISATTNFTKAVIFEINSNSIVNCVTQSNNFNDFKSCINEQVRIKDKKNDQAVKEFLMQGSNSIATNQ